MNILLLKNVIFPASFLIHRIKQKELIETDNCTLFDFLHHISNEQKSDTQEKIKTDFRTKERGSEFLNVVSHHLQPYEIIAALLLRLMPRYCRCLGLPNFHSSYNFSHWKVFM